MAELSREAMQALELTPAWRLRERYRPVGKEAAGGQGILIMGLARDAESQRLWQAIGRAMTRMGYDSTTVANALMLPAVVMDRVMHEIVANKPDRLMVFGDEMAAALTESAGTLLAQTKLVVLPSLASMTVRADSAVPAKRHCWAQLISVRNIKPQGN